MCCRKESNRIEGKLLNCVIVFLCVVRFNIHRYPSANQATTTSLYVRLLQFILFTLCNAIIFCSESNSCTQPHTMEWIFKDIWVGIAAKLTIPYMTLNKLNINTSASVLINALFLFK